MKLATLKSSGPDGALIVVSRDLARAQQVTHITATLQSAIEDWPTVKPKLEDIYEELNDNQQAGFKLEQSRLAAPLPRTYQWLDGSAYLSHVKRVRKSRGAELPDQLLTDPLMYQGGGDSMLGPRDPICLPDEDWGLDFESEIGIITDEVPMGVTPEEAAAHIQLVLLINDLSLRNLIPAELAKGFGFLQGKPSSALSPVAVTPDELATTWNASKLHLPLMTWLNDEQMGNPDAGEDMQFNFAQLISHAAYSRRLCAGTLIGSGTVSNEDSNRGCSCLLEKRVLEIIATGKTSTPFMKVGDRVRIAMHDAEGQSIFGDIEQEVISCQK